MGKISIEIAAQAVPVRPIYIDREFLMHVRRQIRNVIICYQLVVYAIAYVSVCVDPYWYDDSPKGEYIPWPER